MLFAQYQLVKLAAVTSIVGLLLAACATTTPPPPLDLACADLARAAIPMGRVTKAALIPAGKQKVNMRTSSPEFEVPAHCDVWGRLRERTGVDGKPYHIGFNLRLPLQWNGRFLFQGGGGTDGVIRESVGLLPGGGQSAGALLRGFAVVSTDAGHQDETGPLGSYLFGLDPQARSDLGYAHLPPVNAAALALIHQAYGRSPDYRYFSGCSNGGRQGMMAAQRFPDLFDGIIAGAPAYRVPYAAAEATQQIQLLATISPKAANGRPLIGSAFSRNELKTVADGILNACDALDGAKDGMVHDIKGCQFSPKTLVCAAGQTTGCLTAAKADVVEKLFAGAKLSNGTRFYSDWPFDPGLNHPGWMVWRIGLNPTAMPPGAVNATLIPGSLAYAFTTPPDQPTDLYEYALNYKADLGVPKLSARSGIYKESADEHSNPTSTNLDGFKARRGKILFFHGMSDPIFSANDTVRYVEALRARDSVAEFERYSRLYLVPGMTHCSGGVATDKFEMLQPMMDWVEKGIAPQQLVGEAGPQSPWPKRTRPLCAWPQQAFYKGQGDLESAASFVCR